MKKTTQKDRKHFKEESISIEAIDPIERFKMLEIDQASGRLLSQRPEHGKLFLFLVNVLKKFMLMDFMHGCILQKEVARFCNLTSQLPKQFGTSCCCMHIN